MNIALEVSINPETAAVSSRSGTRPIQRILVIEDDPAIRKLYSDQLISSGYALPKTPLYERLKAAGRIVGDEQRDSNIEFLQPYEQVVSNWRRIVAGTYAPKALYQRYATQAKKTYPHRRRHKHPLRLATPRNLHRAFSMLSRLIWYAGLKSHYRAEFWSMFWTQLRQGRIENIFQIAMVAHHLINYALDCVAGRTHASNYTKRIRPQPSAGDEAADADRLVTAKT